MRRKRRFRGIWLPVLGSTGNAGTGGQDDASMLLAVDLAADGSSTVGVRPILFDTPQEAESLDIDAGIGLGAFIKNAYSLRRLVGKVHCEFEDLAYQDGDPTGRPTVAQVTCGFFVARAGDINDPQGENQPIGGNAALVGSYRPAGLDNIREPWLWRRQWLLGNPGIQQGVIAGDIVGFQEIQEAVQWPSSTALFGSVLDGPHLDAKTRRTVSSDDRLWFALEARTYPYNRTYTLGGGPAAFVRAHLDIRAFGAPRRDRNRGNF